MWRVGGTECPHKHASFVNTGGSFEAEKMEVIGLFFSHPIIYITMDRAGLMVHVYRLLSSVRVEYEGSVPARFLRGD